MMPICIRCPKWMPFFWWGAVLMTIRPFIFINATYWASISDAERDMQMKHEHIHLLQQRSPLFYFRYNLSKAHRLAYELEAYRINIRYYLNLGWSRSLVIASIGTILSSQTYGHMVGYASACYHVATIISEIRKEAKDAIL